MKWPIGGYYKCVIYNQQVRNEFRVTVQHKLATKQEKEHYTVSKLMLTKIACNPLCGNNTCIRDVLGFFLLFLSWV